MILKLSVTCPHCGASGQVIFPPFGAMIIGPCPSCNEMVVIFCNKVLGLNSDIIIDGDEEQKKLHIMNVLTEFLWDRVEKVVGKITEENLVGLRDYTDEEDATSFSQDSDQPSDLEVSDPPQISQEEVEKFAQTELDQIDDGNTFHNIFD